MTAKTNIYMAKILFPAYSQLSNVITNADLIQEESRLVNKQYRLTTKSTDQTGNVNLYASVIFRGLPLVRDTL